MQLRSIGLLVIGRRFETHEKDIFPQ